MESLLYTAFVFFPHVTPLLEGVEDERSSPLLRFLVGGELAKLNGRAHTEAAKELVALGIDTRWSDEFVTLYSVFERCILPREIDIGCIGSTEYGVTGPLSLSRNAEDVDELKAPGAWARPGETVTPNLSPEKSNAASSDGK